MAKKKKHWTQTPEGREHMRTLAKERAIVKRAVNAALTENGANRGGDEIEPTADETYLYGKCETLIEVYARSKCLSFPAVAVTVASLLLREAQRQMVGTHDSVSGVRRNAAK